MYVLKTTLSYKVSEGHYCNLTRERHKGFPVTQRCRFATETSKGHFVCVLHNMPLVVEEAGLIHKAQQCLWNMAKRTHVIPDEPAEPVVQHNVKDIMSWTIKEYTKVYRQLIAEGYPEKLAEATAKKYVMK